MSQDTGVDLVIAREHPDQPDIVALIEALDAHAMSLYPPESNHLLDIASLCDPSVTFIVARIEGKALGCGALLHDARGWGEVKRMYVRPEARGWGIGRFLLASIEGRASHLKLPMLRLETGIRNTEALALYRSVGFQDCAPFGDYAPDPLSVFMEKTIARPGEPDTASPTSTRRH
jgi:putative acetyltransferase